MRMQGKSIFAASALVFGALLSISGSTAIAAPPKSPASAGPPLGINLAGVVDWSTEQVFVDAFKASRTWVSHAAGKPWGQGGPLELTPEGWVKRLADGQTAEALMFTSETGCPHGTYECTYDGEGSLELAGAAKMTSHTAGHVVAVADSAPGPLSVRILKTNPENPIRNIRVVRSDEPDARATFRRPFLDRYRGFGVLRFMDWQRTNASPLVHWRDRAIPEQQTQGSDRGVALEYMVELANELKTDPWFCVPHQADDDFVREMAKFVKEHLAPDRKAYLEYTNEAWNGGFEQARYCAKRGKELGLSQNAFEAQLRFYSQRSADVFGIWEDVFSGHDRLVRVLAAQSVNPWTGTTVMDFGGAAKHADAIAIAPYFGHDFGNPKKADEVAKLSVEQVLDGCRAMIDENAKITAKYAAEAKQRGLQLTAYEGGQHLVGFAGGENNAELQKLFLAANRHPRMKELYLHDLEQWKAAGGGMFCVFSSMGTYSKWGSWGLLETEGQDPQTAPKWLAVQAVLHVGAKP